MKKALVVLMVVLMLAVAAAAYAHQMGKGYGPMMGGGSGMMGGGCGPMMMHGGPSEKFLDDTIEQRKALHGKMFEYMEAARKDDDKKTGALEAEIEKLSEEINSKMDKKDKGSGCGCGMPGGYGW